MANQALNLSDNKRSAARLFRQPEHSWQLNVESDLLITKNITDISPTGLSFKAPTSSSFEAGQLLRIQLSLSQGESFECFAKIIWVKSPAPKTGVMKQFGARFINLPAKYDSLISREIFDAQIKEGQRLEVPQRVRPRAMRSEAQVTARSIVKKILGYTVLTFLAVALVSAAWIHKIDHPEESIAAIFNKAMITKIGAKLQPRSTSSE